MAFQFQCPQGHLLEGEESQAGQQLNCPVCGMLFIIPAPIGAPAVAGPFEAAPAPWSAMGGDPPAPAAPFVPGGGDYAPSAPQQPEVLHIPCPNGHELETPLDMLDQEVLCPQCQAQFKLRRKNSVEYKRKKEEQERLHDAKLSKTWLNAAIVAVVLVGLGLVGLIIMAAMG